MAITQMVGARYVTKFYENTEDGTPTWQAGVAYEALICVAYNHSAFVSKIPVPATIGNPAENPTYWAEFESPAMGLWEELKIRLDQEISDRTNGDADLLSKLNQEISNREAGDAALQTGLDQEIADRKAADASAKEIVIAALNAIIEKFYGGGTLNEETGAITWGDSGKAVVGNLNIYGNDDLTSYIKSHADPAENDVKVN